MRKGGGEDGGTAQGTRRKCGRIPAGGRREAQHSTAQFSTARGGRTRGGGVNDRGGGLVQPLFPLGARLQAVWKLLLLPLVSSATTGCGDRDGHGGLGGRGGPKEGRVAPAEFGRRKRGWVGWVLVRVLAGLAGPTVGKDVLGSGGVCPSCLFAYSTLRVSWVQTVIDDRGISVVCW